MNGLILNEDCNHYFVNRSNTNPGIREVEAWAERMPSMLLYGVECAYIGLRDLRKPCPEGPAYGFQAPL